MKKNIKSSFVFFLAALLFATSSIVLPSQSAYASDTNIPSLVSATKGMQLRIPVGECTHPPNLAIIDITVTGKNQDGKFVTWRFGKIYDGAASAYTTTNWWWVGPVTVVVHVSIQSGKGNGQQGVNTVTATVPKTSPNSNVFSIPVVNVCKYIAK